jgi:uncharacterized membrane protein
VNGPAGPLERRLRIGLACVATLGLGVSCYLVAVRLSGEAPVCAIASGCAEVQKSGYSELAGIPVAALGLAAYLALIACAALRGDAGRVGGLFTAVVGVGFSAWLTYVELAILDAVCIWCVVSAVLMTVALAIVAVRVLATGRPVAPAAGTAGGAAHEDGTWVVSRTRAGD